MRRRIIAALVHTQLLCLIVLGCAQQSHADDSQPTLLTLSKELECAASPEQAAKLLQSYQGINLPSLSLPNEWFGSDKPASLHAASLDIALYALTRTNKRFPELAADVEQVILQWSYCEVLLDDTFYDFFVTGAEHEKRIANAVSPIDWKGFYNVGFLGEHDDRLVIDAFKHDDSPFVFYEVDFSTLFRRQCLPHPQTSKLYYTKETYFPWRVIQDNYTQSEEYPYSWQAGCSAEQLTQPVLAANLEKNVLTAKDEPDPPENDGVADWPKNPDGSEPPDLQSAVAIEVAKNDGIADWPESLDSEQIDKEGQLVNPQDVINQVEVASIDLDTSNSVVEQLNPVLEDTNAPPLTDATQQAVATQSIEVLQGAASAQINTLGDSSQESVSSEEQSVNAEGEALAQANDIGQRNGDGIAFASAISLIESAEVIDISAFVGVSDTQAHTSVKNASIADETQGSTVQKENAVTGLNDATDAVLPVYELDNPTRHQITEEERVRLVARRLFGYRYELIKKQESMLTMVTGPGYRYYKTPFRPEEAADGIPDYVAANRLHNNLVDGIADYVTVDRKEELSTENSPDANALIASASELGQRWLKEVEYRNFSYGYRNPVNSIKPARTFVPVTDEQQASSAFDALPSLPVVVAEGAAGPAVVFEAVPEPIQEEEKPPQIRTKRKKKYYGFNGFFTLGNRSFDGDGFSLTAGASYKPIKDSYWFARSSWNYRFDDEEFRYTWGIGYDDWHPGTFSVQLNHWGPLLPGDYLDLDNAIASATYKFNKNKFMKKHKVSSSVTLSQKISGDPVFSWSNSWSPLGKWFVRSTISQPLKGGDTSWSYGFGYANYSPFTFSFEYNNWGYNKAFEYNFKENANLSFTYRWRY